MSKPPPTKRTKKGGDGNRVTGDDIFIPADTNVEWREKFNEKINKELKSIKEKGTGATSVLLEEEYRAIVNYLLEVQKTETENTDHRGDAPIHQMERQMKKAQEQERNCLLRRKVNEIDGKNILD
jgi:hypothetical protein